MKNSKKWFLSALLCLGFTAACVTPLPNYTKPLDYNTLLPYRLAVAGPIILVDAVPDAFTRSLGEHYGKTPEAAFREWMVKRIESVGTAGQITAEIEEASLSSKALHVGGGINGYFRRDQAEEWSGALSVTLKLSGSAQGYPPAQIHILVHSAQTVPEKAGDYEKKEIYQSIINDLIRLFDAEAQKQINSYFSAYRV